MKKKIYIYSNRTIIGNRRQGDEKKPKSCINKENTPFFRYTISASE